jgi:predicted nucleic acid-binding protein
MHRVLVDSDIILDLLAKRDPFYNHAAKLFTLIETGTVKGFTTPVIISNIFYILSKLKNKDDAGKLIRKLRLLFGIIEVNEKIVDLALESDFTDFEDSIQYYSARQNDINFIITRNIKDYRLSKIKVVTAEEYCSLEGFTG